ncbi:LysR family transcriptional regulator [Sphingobium nicotianae]|uniref:LysR family transcriptional regulator n=1 Tax=Sphingobium nicotianae TaxID=2782607 RepID=A0A9X1DAC0_9SPHN|nr:LysR family transcriptional regulator [Sphingobium nicotianae]MBT2186326.1 LysR family transcriptional regulator [Sphingobium nicotianae]
MELRHLRYFRAIAREENFSRAAQALRVAQPALTRRIRDLEEELGVELFERLPRGIRLSPAGRVFLTEVEEILAHVDRAVDGTRRYANGNLGTIRVGLSEIIAGDEFITRSLLHFRETEPGVVLELRSLGALLQIAVFKNAQLDAGILYDANIDEHDATLLNRAKLGRGEVMLAVHRGHRFAERDSVGMAELADEPMLWPERRLQPDYHDRLMRAWLKKGAPPNIVQDCTTNSILLSFVSVGMGIGPVTATQPVVAARDIRLVRISDLGLAFDLLLVWRKHDPSAALRRFVDAMVARSAAGRAG